MAANANSGMYTKIIIEDKRAKSMSDIESKRSRGNKVIVYVMPDRLTVEECAEEFMEAFSVLEVKPKIEVVSRLGNIRNDMKPRPIRIQLDSKFVKEKLVARAYRLRANPRFASIYIKSDERTVQKELWQELKKKISEQPEKRWKIRNNGVVENIQLQQQS